MPEKKNRKNRWRQPKPEQQAEAPAPAPLPPAVDGWVTPDQLARGFGVSLRTIKRWSKRPDFIPSIKYGSKRRTARKTSKRGRRSARSPTGRWRGGRRDEEETVIQRRTRAIGKENRESE